MLILMKINIKDQYIVAIKQAQVRQWPYPKIKRHKVKYMLAMTQDPLRTFKLYLSFSLHCCVTHTPKKLGGCFSLSGYSVSVTATQIG